MKLLKILFLKRIEQKKEELVKIQAEIDNRIENMLYAKIKLSVPEDYLYSDLTKLWVKRKRYNQFIKFFG